MIRLLSLLSLATLAIGLSGQSAAQQSSGALELNQWVQGTENGRLVGTVTVAAPSGSSEPVPLAVVVLAGKQGEAYRATTDESGRFAIDNVEHGVYSLTARGKETFAIYAFHVVDQKQRGAEMLPAHAEIVAARIDQSTVKAASLRYLPARLEQPTVDLDSFQLERLAEQGRWQKSLRIRQTDAGLEGLIQTAGAVGGELQGAANMNVFVFADGVEISRAVTSEEGKFRIEDLPTGPYTALAVGPAGMAVVGFELIDPSVALATQPPSPTGEGQFVAATPADSDSNQLVVQAAPLPAVNEVAGGTGEEIPAGVPMLEEPFVAGGGGGGLAGGGGMGAIGGGGGGGGGFAGGGFGGLGALAGLGAAAAVAADNGEDDLVVPPPASPVIPAGPILP